MARRPFDPGEKGWKKVVYRRGDVLDRRKVTRLVEEADVVIHLAFMIMGSAKASRRVNLDGSRNVFEAAAAAGVKTADLRILGRRLRVPQGQPAAADRGRARARHLRALLLRAEGRGRVAAGGRPLRLPHEGLRVQAVHRRRAARAAADRQPAVHAGLRAAARPRPEPARRRADPTPGASRSRRAVPARAPRRRRAPRCGRRRSAAASQASTTSPGRAS